MRLEWILKLSHSPYKIVVFIYFGRSPLKMMKNAFYFMLKALFVLELFTFVSLLFGYAEKQLDKNSLISKFIMSQTGQQIIRIHILPIS